MSDDYQAYCQVCGVVPEVYADRDYPLCQSCESKEYEVK